MEIFHTVLWNMFRYMKKGILILCNRNFICLQGKIVKIMNLFAMKNEDLRLINKLFIWWKYDSVVNKIKFRKYKNDYL